MGPFSPPSMDSTDYSVWPLGTAAGLQGHKLGPACCRKPVHRLQPEQVRAGLPRLLSLRWFVVVIAMVTRGWKLRQ